MKQKAIIVDLDGTLAKIDHRLHYVRGDKKRQNWGKFFKEIPNDEVNKWCHEIITRFSKNYPIIVVLLVSGRPADHEDATREWLIKNAIWFDKLLMRSKGDYRQDSIVKEEIYKRDIEPNYEVLFCIDDRQQVVDKWRELGLTVLQCAKGDF